jgi:hypothetical protein
MTVARAAAARATTFRTVTGALSYHTIKEDLFSPATVAVGLLVGGVAMLLIESRLPQVKRCGLDSITWREALAVGLFQCLALWPGVSRSAATIMGGMLIGIERKTAAEYSFSRRFHYCWQRPMICIRYGIAAIIGVPIWDRPRDGVHLGVVCRRALHPVLEPALKRFSWCKVVITRWFCWWY